MPFRPLFLLRTESKIDQPSVFAFVVALAIAVLLGSWLWLIGLDLVRSGPAGGRRAGASRGRHV